MIEVVGALADELYSKTCGLSSIQTMTAMPEFGELLGYGDITVRYILGRMQTGEMHIVWFPLLKRITEADPVPVEERGKVNDMRKRWVAWGQEQGFC